MNETRSEHMRWCKQRALVYADRGDLVGALASMASDVTKHEETNTEATTLLLAMIGPTYVVHGDATGMRRFIEGFAE